MYLTYHSFARGIYYPWGYSDTVGDAKNINKLRELGNIAADAMKHGREGPRYEVGNTAKLLDPAAGTMVN